MRPSVWCREARLPSSFVDDLMNRWIHSSHRRTIAPMLTFHRASFAAALAATSALFVINACSSDSEDSWTPSAGGTAHGGAAGQAGTAGAAGQSGQAGTAGAAGQSGQAGSAGASTGGASNECGGADLTSDPKNCGTCGHDCDGGACKSGVCQGVVLVSGQRIARSLVQDATSLYWIVSPSSTDSGIMKVAKSGGTPEWLVPVQSQFLWGMAVANGELYYAASEAKPDGAIMKVPVSGGTPVAVVTGRDYPASVAVDSTAVYWSEGMPGWALATAPLAGGSAVLLAQSEGGDYRNARAIAVDSSGLFWTVSKSDPSVKEAAVMKSGLQAGPATSLVSGLLEPWGILLNASVVYWTDVSDNTVSKVPSSGGDVVVLATGENATDLAIQGDSIYWGNSSAIRKMPVSGGTPVSIVAGQTNPGWVNVDDASVYWIDNPTPETGKIVRSPR